MDTGGQGYKGSLTIGKADGGQAFTFNNNGTLGDGADTDKLIITQTDADKPVNTFTLNNGATGTIKDSFQLDLKNSNATISNEGKIGDATAVTITSTNRLDVDNKKAGTMNANITAKDFVMENAGTFTGKITVENSTLTRTSSLKNTGTFTGDIAVTKSDFIINNSGKMTDNTKKITFTGYDDATKKYVGQLTLNNDTEGTIEQTVEITKGLATINNSGTMSGAITGNETSNITIRNTGTISGGVAGTKAELTIENSGKMTDNSKKITFTGYDAAAADDKKYVGQLTLNNNAYAVIEQEVEITDGKAIITNSGKMGTITTIDKTAGQGSDLHVTNNRGGSINTITVDKNTQNFGFINSGNIETLQINTAEDKAARANPTNMVTNNVGGSIKNISFGDTTPNKHSNLTLSNSMGSIGKFTVANNSNTSANVTITGNYAVDMTEYGEEIPDGAGGTTLVGAINVNVGGNGKLNFNVGNNVKIVLSGLRHDREYDLTKFVGGTSTSVGNITLNNQVINPDDLANMLSTGDYFRTTQSIFGISLANGKLVSRIHVDRSIGAQGLFQNIATLNAQITRTTNMVDSVFDSISYGEFGKAENMIMKDDEDSKTGANNQEETIEIQRKPYVAYLMPYYSAMSINQKGGSSFGLIGGITKESEKGVLYGFHAGFDSSSVGKSDDEMQLLGSSLMVGLHVKASLKEMKAGKLALTPYIKGHLNGMLQSNTYRLTPLANKTIEDTGITGAYNISAVFGLDIPTNIGYFAPELGFMSQGVFSPELTWAGFHAVGGANGDDQTFLKTQATPTYFLASLRYAKEIKIGTSATLYPTLKAGMRAIMFGNTYATKISLISLQNPTTVTAMTALDGFSGFVELGLGARLSNNLVLNVSYNGDFSKRVMVNSFFGKVGFRF